MDRFETEYRRLIDGLVRELVALARDWAKDEMARARAAEREERRRAPKVSARLARALERAEERRRLAAERRAAVGRSRRSAPGASPAPSSRAHAAPAAPPAPPAPPPLFVHKRSRDGSIQQLERGAGESAPPA